MSRRKVVMAKIDMYSYADYDVQPKVKGKKPKKSKKKKVHKFRDKNAT